MKTFEQHLEDICFEENPQVLDDDMADFLDDWLGGMGVDDIIKLGDEILKRERQAN